MIKNSIIKYWMDEFGAEIKQAEERLCELYPNDNIELYDIIHIDDLRGRRRKIGPNKLIFQFKLNGQYMLLNHINEIIAQ